MIGGRAKEKKSKIVENYLIFAYEKEGQVDYISFQIENNFESKAEATLFNNKYFNIDSKDNVTHIL